jgi:hypothetical protein
MNPEYIDMYKVRLLDYREKLLLSYPPPPTSAHRDLTGWKGLAS